MLFDGQCLLCSREAAALRRADHHGHIAFEDITASAFNPQQYGLTIKQVLGAMHAIRPDGSVLRGIDALAALYDAVGWTWLARRLRWRLTRPLAHLAYRVFAAIRPRFSGFRPGTCVNGVCSPRADSAAYPFNRTTRPLHQTAGRRY
jgi:predicted DCC family thiol-disulfide oxidoreductase YuxK